MEPHRSFKSVIEDPDIREVHYQPRREFLPHMSERGTFQADLMFLDSFKGSNKGYSGLLTIINVGSRYGYAVPFKRKSDTTDAFEAFLVEAHHNNQPIKRLETDSGSEFLNAKFQALLKKHNISHSVGAAGDHLFTSVVERFNGSLRNWITQYLTAEKHNRWVDTMPEIIKFYNERKHRTLGVAPASMTPEDEDELRHQQYDATDEVRAQVNSIRPGDKVRLLLHKTAFAKGRNRWSDGVYTIKERLPNSYSFSLVETPTLYKYSAIQLVRDDAKNIGAKTARTQAMDAERAHALRFARSGLARGVEEAKEVMHSPAPPKDGPRRNPGRERAVPARLRVDLGELRAPAGAVPYAPKGKRAEVRAERAAPEREDPPFALRGIVEPRRSARARAPPAWMRDFAK